MLKTPPLWTYRYVPNRIWVERDFRISPLFTPDYIVETHFCLNRSTGLALWEEPDFYSRSGIEVLALYDHVILATMLVPDQSYLGLYRFDLNEGIPLFPAEPEPRTVLGKMRKRWREKHWKDAGQYRAAPRSSVSEDGLVKTLEGFVDLRTGLVVAPWIHEETVVVYHRSDGTFPVVVLPQGTVFHGDGAKWKEHEFWLESESGHRLWTLEISERTFAKRINEVTFKVCVPFLYILLAEGKAGIISSERGAYELLVLNLTTGELEQRLYVAEEAIAGSIIGVDEKGLLFGNKEEISGRHSFELAYFVV